MTSPTGPDALLDRVYEELRAIARARLSAERQGHTLQATALVHEAWLRVAGSDRPIADEAHLLRAAATAMRRILVEHARARGRAKRDRGAARVPVSVVDLASRADPAEILSVDEAVRRLEERDARLAELVQLRFYAGLTEEQAARALGVSARTARRDWAVARAWLHRELGGRHP